MTNTSHSLTFCVHRLTRDLLGESDARCGELRSAAATIVGGELFGFGASHSGGRHAKPSPEIAIEMVGSLIAHKRSDLLDTK